MWTYQIKKVFITNKVYGRTGVRETKKPLEGAFVFIMFYNSIDISSLK